MHSALNTPQGLLRRVRLDARALKPTRAWRGGWQRNREKSAPRARWRKCLRAWCHGIALGPSPRRWPMGLTPTPTAIDPASVLAESLRLSSPLSPPRNLTHASRWPIGNPANLRKTTRHELQSTWPLKPRRQPVFAGPCPKLGSQRTQSSRRDGRPDRGAEKHRSQHQSSWRRRLHRRQFQGLHTRWRRWPRRGP